MNINDFLKNFESVWEWKSTIFNAYTFLISLACILWVKIRNILSFLFSLLIKMGLINIDSVLSKIKEPLSNLEEACKYSDDISTIEKLISLGHKVTIHSLFIIIYKYNQMDILELLLKKYEFSKEKEDTDALIKILNFLCAEGNVKMAKFLIQNGVKPTSESLYEACRFSQNRENKYIKIELVILLLDNGVPIINNCLYEACCHHDVEAVKILLRYNKKQTNKSLNVSNTNDKKSVMNDEETLNRCLDQCCKNGAIDLVRLFLQNGVKPTSQCLYTACSNGCSLEIIALLLKYGAQATDLCLYKFCNRTDPHYDKKLLVKIFDKLIENGAKPNSDCLYETCDNSNIFLAGKILSHGVKKLSVDDEYSKKVLNTQKKAIFLYEKSLKNGKTIVDTSDDIEIELMSKKNKTFYKT